MADELWLQLPRDRVTERGYGVAHRPGDVAGRLSGTFAIDPLTGYGTARVVASMEDAWDWVTGGSADYLISTPWALPGGGFGEAVSHRAAGNFQIATSGGPGAGEGWFFGFICYGGSRAFSLSFGADQLDIDAGRVIWTRAGEEQARGQLWHAEEWETAPHYLYVYAIGNRLACRRLGTSPSDLDPGLLIETGALSAEAALSGGALTLRGAGFLTFAVAPERHEQTPWLLHSTIGLPEPSTQVPTMTVQSLTPAGGSILYELQGPDGAVLPGEGPYTGFAYQINGTLASDTGPNLYVTRVRVQFPELVENDAVTPVDLCTFDPAGLGGTGIVRGVTVRRGPEPESAGLTLELLTVTDDVAPYIQPHMKGRWEPGGAAWMTFYTSRPELLPNLNSDSVRIDCESQWKQLRLAKWTGAASYGGRRLAEAYRDVALKAGIDSADIVIYSGGYDLPEEQADERPLFDFRAGQPLSEVLLYLRDQFGPNDRLVFKADGKFYVEPLPTTPIDGAAFVWTTAAEHIAAVAAGTSTVRRVLEWSEGFTEDGLANDVWVIGQHRSGRPLVAVATDWDSVRNPLARNYVAGFRPLTIIDAGLPTQGLVNWVARSMLERVKRPRLTAQMRGTTVSGMVEHDIIEVAGKGLWRATSISVLWDLEAPNSESFYELDYFGPAES
jgi:hypothetical protein